MKIPIKALREKMEKEAKMNNELYDKIKKFKKDNIPKDMGLLLIDKRAIDEYKLKGAIILSLKDEPTRDLLRHILEIDVWEDSK